MIYDYDGIERRLLALRELVLIVTPDLAGWFDEYVDVGEYGLAVEVVAEALPPGLTSPQVRALAAGLLREAEGMRLGDEIVRPLQAVSRVSVTRCARLLGPALLAVLSLAGWRQWRRRRRRLVRGTPTTRPRNLCR